MRKLAIVSAVLIAQARADSQPGMQWEYRPIAGVPIARTLMLPSGWKACSAGAGAKLGEAAPASKLTLNDDNVRVVDVQAVPSGADCATGDKTAARATIADDLVALPSAAAKVA